MRNISHTNQMRRRWVVSLERYVNIVLLQGFPVIMQYNFAYKSGKLIVSHWKVIYEYVMANRW